jgi:hypothetical protein
MYSGVAPTGTYRHVSGRSWERPLSAVCAALPQDYTVLCDESIGQRSVSASRWCVPRVYKQAESSGVEWSGVG